MNPEGTDINELGSRSRTPEECEAINDFVKSKSKRIVLTPFELINKLENQLKEKNMLYNELLMAVETKFSDESRHETALRYIKEAENRKVEPSENLEDRIWDKIDELNDGYYYEE